MDWTDKRNPKPANKVLTDRGSVSIHDHEAESNNSNFTRTKLYYEEDVKVVSKSVERMELESQAKELGITFRENISDAKLKDKIETNINS